MKLFILTMAAALMLLTALPATAQNEITAKAHEVRLSALRLPATPSGSVAFKACDTCEYTTRRVSGNTRWVLNNKTVSLAEFRAGLASVRNRSEAWVTVLHDLGSDQITRVAVTVY
ncbi:MAG: hypothetical protein AAFX56_20090 [Pseudomonadota bacterium]